MCLFVREAAALDVAGYWQAKAIHAVVDASRRVGGDAGLSSSTEGGGKEEERPPLTHRELQELVMESLDGYPSTLSICYLAVVNSRPMPHHSCFLGLRRV